MSGPQDQRPPRRRALPTVSDVVRELRGSTTAEPELLFKAARQVCAEELNRAKQGFEPAPMEILVKRARRLLGVVEDLPTLRMERPEEMAAAGAPSAPPTAAESPLAFVFETEPDPEPLPEPPQAPAPPPPPVPRQAPAPAAAPAPTPRFVLSAAEEPFLETTGSIDLKGIWSRKVSLLDDPLAPLGESTPALAAPPPSAPPEGPTMALPLGGIDLLTPSSEPIPAPPAPSHPEEVPAPPAPIVAPVPAPAVVEPPFVPVPPPAAGEASRPAAAPETPEPSPLEPRLPAEPVSVLFPDGPGEETLDRLKVEAASVRFEEVLPSLEPPAAPIVPDIPAPLPPLSLPDPLPAPKAIAPPAVEPVREEPLPAAKAGAEKGSGAVRWKDVEAETSSLFSPSPAAPPRSRAPLAAAVLVLGAGAIGWYLLHSRGSAPPAAPAAPTAVPTEAVAPPTVSTPPVASAPTQVPAPPAPAAGTSVAPTAIPATATPVPAMKAEAVPAPTVVHTQPAAGQSRAATVTTPDWAGKEPVFAVHFSSYRDRATADKDAARLGKSLERPGRAISVDLGEKGVWFRVMIGEFGTVEEALAYRAELEQKGTPNMGFVYRIVGKAP